MIRLTHPNAASLWLLIVSHDDRYRTCLSLDLCANWLVQQDGFARQAEQTGDTWHTHAMTIDNDGDAFVFTAPENLRNFDRYDTQAVMVNGVVQPYNDAMAEYFAIFDSRLED